MTDAAVLAALITVGGTGAFALLMWLLNHRGSDAITGATVTDASTRFALAASQRADVADAELDKVRRIVRRHRKKCPVDDPALADI